MSGRLHLGFLLFEYFPYGGLQRDCLKTAQVCAARGHRVTLYTRDWEGPKPEGIETKVFGQRGCSNVSRNRIWMRRLEPVLAGDELQGVIGFNKLPGLDVYFGSDPCYVAKMKRLRPAWYRWSGRYRHFSRCEAEVFARGTGTQVLLLTPHEISVYRDIYGTEEERFHVLPPGIQRRTFDAGAQARARRRVRERQGWPDGTPLIVFIGSGFRIKGLDRAMEALASLPDASAPKAQLVVIGKNHPSPFSEQARRLGVADRVHFLGGRDDVTEWMLAADLLLHPAYSEAAGMVLLEAMTCGLPVLTTDTCGYAAHVRKAEAGCVLESPFDQAACNRALADMMSSEDRTEWGARGLAYAASEDLYSCHEKAADIIEQAARGGTRGIEHGM